MLHIFANLRFGLKSNLIGDLSDSLKKKYCSSEQGDHNLSSRVSGSNGLNDDIWKDTYVRGSGIEECSDKKSDACFTGDLGSFPVSSPLSFPSPSSPLLVSLLQHSSDV